MIYLWLTRANLLINKRILFLCSNINLNIRCITVNNLIWAIWATGKYICNFRWHGYITIINFYKLIDIFSLLRSNINRFQNLWFFLLSLLLLKSSHDLPIFAKRRFLCLKYSLLLYFLNFLPIRTTFLNFSRLCTQNHQNCNRDGKNGYHYANKYKNISFTLSWFLRLIPSLLQ